MRIEVNVNDTWVDDLITASLRDSIRKNREYDDVPTDAMIQVLEYFSVHEDHIEFLEDIGL